MNVEIQGVTFVLLYQKAVYWPDKKTLIIGDLHLGKISHFRKEGIALPQQAIGTNFTRLDELMGLYDVQRIIFLGDLFHSTYNAEWELFATWRNRHRDVEMLIVLGNHDILPRFLFDESNIKVYVEDYTEDEFVFAHHPSEAARHAFLFAGHLHPVFALHGKARQSLRVPCFMECSHQLVLPCFGVFTGGYQINNLEYEHAYLVSGKEVLKLEKEKGA